MFSKNIKFLVYIYTFYSLLDVFLVTEDGEKYSWCNTSMGNTVGEEKNRKFLSLNLKRPVHHWPDMTDWSNIRITKTAVNCNNILFLTDERKMYCCHIYKDSIGLSLLMEQTDIKEEITYIACGERSYVVLTDKGDVYEWNIEHEITPQKLTKPRKVTELSAKIVVKIVHGCHHILALTDKGQVYGWGANYHGQLNAYSLRNLIPPVMINIPNVNKVSDIAAKNNMSAFKSSKDGLVYMQGRLIQWSDCNYSAISEYTNIFDVCNSSQSKMNRKYTDDEFTILKDLETAFNNRSTSDLTIQVKSKFIYVHKYILKRRSLYFESMFRFNWLENRQRIIKYDDHSYVVYIAFFKYLYTGVINLSSLKDKLELLKLSNKYCVTNLERDCIQTIKRDTNL